MLKLRKIKKNFGNLTVLKSIDLDINEKEIESLELDITNEEVDAFSIFHES